MTWRPVPLCDGTYADEARTYSAQDLVGFIPRKVEARGTRATDSIIFPGAPGLYGCGTVGEGPCRGLYEAEGKFFGVFGTGVRLMRADRSALRLGTIPATSRVSFAHNQANGGNEVAIATGHDGYTYDTTTGVFSKITDVSFPGAKVFDYIGQYIVGVEPLGRYWFHSDLAAAREYISLDRYEAESSPDRIRGLIVANNRVVVFGQRTTEFFVNEPLSANEAFQNTRTTLDVGCAATHSVKKMDGAVFFLTHHGQIHMLRGYQSQRISTHAIEQAIAGLNWANAFAFTFEDEGHAIYYLTFPDGPTFGYDLSTGRWHRRRSYGIDRWRANALCKWDGRWYAGDYGSNEVFTLDWDWAQEGDDVLPRKIGTGIVHDNGNWVPQPAVQLVADVKPQVAPDITPFWTAITIDPPAADMLLADNIYHTYTQTGAIGSVTWSVTSGDLPDGLTLVDADDTTISLSGTPEVDGTFTFTLRCTEDATGHYGELSESIVVSPQYFAFATSETDLTRIGYGKFNPFSGAFTELATLDRDGSQAIGNPGCVINGRLVGRVEFDNVNVAPDQQSGLYLLAYDGTTTLDNLDFWQYSAAEDHDYLDHCAYDDTTVACVVREGVGLDTFLCAVSVTGANLATAGTPLEIDSSSGDDYALVMHNGTLIVLDFDSVEGARSLRAYTFDGSTWTLAGTYGGTLSGSFGSTLSPMVSNGDHVFLSNGMIFTYSAGTFTLVTTATLAGIGQVIGSFVISGTTYVVYQDGTTAIKAFSFDGATATLVDTLSQTVVAASRGAVVEDGLALGKFIIPGTTPQPDANSGTFRLNGSLSRLSALELSGGSTYAALAQITKLVEA